MKAISIRQPWATLIACGRKTIETRVWPTSYRGELLICSSARGIEGYKVPFDEPLGCALCVVTLADCRLMIKSDREAACCPIYPGAFAWVLENARAVQPFAVTGRLRLFEIEDRLIRVVPVPRVPAA